MTIDLLSFAWVPSSVPKKSRVGDDVNICLGTLTLSFERKGFASLSMAASGMAAPIAIDAHQAAKPTGMQRLNVTKNVIGR